MIQLMMLSSSKIVVIGLKNQNSSDYSKKMSPEFERFSLEKKTVSNLKLDIITRNYAFYNKLTKLGYITDISNCHEEKCLRYFNQKNLCEITAE